MKIKRNCEVCGVEFMAIKATQRYEKRACFKKAYQLRKKAEKAIETARPKVYDYSCAICNRRSEMSFSPVIEQKRFAEYVCPFCGVPRKVIWTHRYDATLSFGTRTAQYVVQSAIASQ